MCMSVPVCGTRVCMCVPVHRTSAVSEVPVRVCLWHACILSVHGVQVCVRVCVWGACKRVCLGAALAVRGLAVWGQWWPWPSPQQPRCWPSLSFPGDGTRAQVQTAVEPQSGVDAGACGPQESSPSYWKSVAM